MIYGTKDKPRLSVFRSNKQIYVQFIDDAEGKTLLSVSSRVKEIAGKTGITKTEQAKLVVNWPLKNPKKAASAMWFSTGMVICIMEELKHWLKLPEKVDLNFNKLCQT